MREFDFGGVKSVRDNVGDAILYGIESMIDLNIKEFTKLSDQHRFNLFINFSNIKSNYIKSDQAGIKNNKIEYSSRNKPQNRVKFWI